jgi:glucosamine 6-phosphate synthetase-like amidotransferase/phosphosugar isomerase protein
VRGNFAYGGLYLFHSTEGQFLVTAKAEGTVKLKNNDALLYDDMSFLLKDMDLFLGHTQAPTSSQRKFDIDTSHPFRCGNWFVAHNGVISNHEILKKKIKNPKDFNKVDSSVIPALLHEHSKKNKKEVKVIGDVLSQLEGTFGLWIHHALSNTTYLARSGSTLYADILTNDFSSLPYKKYIPLKEGIIYQMTNEGLTTVGGFEPNSPFFVL